MANVKFEGQDFELKSGPLNPYLMLKFMATTSDKDPNSQVEPKVMLAVFKASIAAKDFDRFENLAMSVEDDLEDFFERALVIVKARMDNLAKESAEDFPTGQPSDSLDGPGTTPSNSVLPFDDKAWQEAHGRPDIYQMQQAHRQHLQAV